MKLLIYFIYLFVLLASLFTCHPVVDLLVAMTGRIIEKRRSTGHGRGLKFDFRGRICGGIFGNIPSTTFFCNPSKQRDLQSPLIWRIFCRTICFFSLGGGILGAKTIHKTRWICQWGHCGFDFFNGFFLMKSTFERSKKQIVFLGF